MKNNIAPSKDMQALDLHNYCSVYGVRIHAVVVVTCPEISLRFVLSVHRPDNFYLAQIS